MRNFCCPANTYGDLGKYQSSKNMVWIWVNGWTNVPRTFERQGRSFWSIYLQGQDVTQDQFNEVPSRQQAFCKMRDKEEAIPIWFWFDFFVQWHNSFPGLFNAKVIFVGQ